MKTLLALLLLIPSLSWGLTFSNGKQVGGNALTPSNTFQIELTKNPKEAFVYTNEISRAGEKSQKFVLKHNECGAEKGYDDCVNDAQRTERVPKDTDNYKGDVVYYGFSIFLPKDFPSIHPAAVTLGQVKNDGLSQPIWITRIRKDNFNIVTHWNDNECSLIKVDDMKGVWTDFIIKSDFSTKDKEGDVKTIVRKPGTNTYVTEYKNSYLEVWVNNESVCKMTSQILTDEALKYTKKERINFRYGIYQIALSEWFNLNKTKSPKNVKAYDEAKFKGGAEQGTMKSVTGSPFSYDWGVELPTQIVYFDEIRVGSSKDEVDVSLNDEPVD